VSETRFRIDAENVVHETVNGEVIAIEVGNGSYYSLAEAPRRSGAYWPAGPRSRRSAMR
jgi:hypothetical protein